MLQENCVPSKKATIRDRLNDNGTVLADIKNLSEQIANVLEPQPASPTNDNIESGGITGIVNTQYNTLISTRQTLAYIYDSLC